MELSKNDWKLFRERLPGWQERYMDKLTREYAELLTDDRCQPSERFWTLNKRIREDRRKPIARMRFAPRAASPSCAFPRQPFNSSRCLPAFAGSGRRRFAEGGDSGRAPAVLSLYLTA